MEPEPVELHEVTIRLRWSTSADATIAHLVTSDRATSAVSAVLSQDGRTVRTVSGSVYKIVGPTEFARVGQVLHNVGASRPIRWRLFNVHLLQPKEVDHA